MSCRRVAYRRHGDMSVVLSLNGDCHRAAGRTAWPAAGSLPESHDHHAEHLMDISVASWLVIVIAIAAANLPFFNEQVFALVPSRWESKPLFVRLIEMVVLFFAVGHRLRSRRPPRQPLPADWEFYAISACLFLVLAFPGFILRYLRKRHD
jgi:hypothetical protein